MASPPRSTVTSIILKWKNFWTSRIGLVDPSRSSDDLCRDYRVLCGTLTNWSHFDQKSNMLVSLSPQGAEQQQIVSESTQIKRFQKDADSCLWSYCFDFLCQRARERLPECPWAMDRFGPSVTPCMMGGADCFRYLGHLAKAIVCV